MALALRKSEDTGKANFGWLNSKQSFSFGEHIQRKEQRS